MQSIERLTLVLGTGHGLTVCEFEPCIGLCAENPEPAWDSLSASLSAPPSLALSLCLKINKKPFWGAWVAQSVKRPTSAQVMISQSMSSSPTLGSVLTAQSLEPASVSVSPSLSALSSAISLSKNKH